MNVSGLGTMNLTSLVFLFMCHYYYILFLVIIICNNEINFIITYYYIAASFDSNILSLLPVVDDLACRLDGYGCKSNKIYLDYTIKAGR